MFHHRGTEGAEAGKEEGSRSQDPEPFFLPLHLRVLSALCGEDSEGIGAAAVLDKKTCPPTMPATLDTPSLFQARRQP
jgi:hypothetical protein